MSIAIVDARPETGTECPVCDEPLSLSQPDELRPLLLVGYCPSCIALYHIDVPDAPDDEAAGDDDATRACE